MPKRTYQPKKRKRAKAHGFKARSKTKGGKRVLKRRRNKQRENDTKVAKHKKVWAKDHSRAK